MDMDYKEKYEQAFERAKLSRLQLPDIEDERIRESIIDLVEKQMPKSENKKWMRAWLEKQGELKEKPTKEQVWDYCNKISHEWWQITMDKWETLTDEDKNKYNQFIGFNDFSNTLMNITAGALFQLIDTGKLEYEEGSLLLKQCEQKPTCLLDNSVHKVKFPFSFKAKVKSNGKIVTIIEGQLSMDCKEWIKYQSDVEDGYHVYGPEELVDIEQKTTDKAKPKFKVGDWIVENITNGIFVGKITSINTYFYGVDGLDGNWYHIDLFEEERMHLWTIEDAKDGDVLSQDSIPFIFKSWDNNCIAYCGITDFGLFKVVEDDFSWCNGINVTPATKEQSDILFQKMKEAGYEWDAEKKELEKIEPVSAWSKEDETKLITVQTFIRNTSLNGGDGIKKATIDWLKSLKDRVQPQPKQEWSEEENKIRKNCIHFLELQKQHHASTFEIDKCISWLENQSKKSTTHKFKIGDIIKYVGDRAEFVREEYKIKEVLNDDCYYLTTCGTYIPFKFEEYYILVEQKTADKVEPKFKVGNWVVNKNGQPRIFQVTKRSFPDSMLQEYGSTEGFFINTSTLDKQYRLWNIKDAEDGDVLAFDNDTIVIFKDLYNSSTFHSYCYIEDGLFDISKDGMPDWWEGKGFHPATKEQHAMLFAKMKETGYEWDAEKKELKKIEQKPDWSEEDETKLITAQAFIRNTSLNGADGIKEATIDWLKSLKDRVQPQPKQEWSKEDEKNIESIESFLCRSASIPLDLYNTLTNWLKSLKPQNHWKPNKEQMIALRWVLNNVPYNKHKEVISQMVEQFKEL